jgi:medium-chain acyl-[acyl-carrier-protein] hydrolase
LNHLNLRNLPSQMLDKINLYCIPYAGGSATIFMKWRRFLPSNIHVKPLELAGRGTRFKDIFYQSIQDAADDLFAQIDYTEPYAIYAHSMGTLIAYEVLVKITENNLTPPIDIFLSGRYPPHLKPHKIIHDISDEQFIDEIKGMGGTPNEIFNNKELMDIFLPVLKVDYKITEQYNQRQKITFDTDISFFYTPDDPMINRSEIEEWCQYTHGSFKVHHFTGGHFFIHQYYEKMLGIVAQTLERTYYLHEKY